MHSSELASRLSKISTVWTLLGEAHHGPATGAGAARLALIQRYQGAAYRYLLGAVRDVDVADELFQEFALRCVQGKLQRADPQRGRFRDYLKTILFHLVTDHHKRRARQPGPLKSAAEPAAPAEGLAPTDQQFAASWRETLLEHAWNGLAEAQRQGGQPYYSVLRYRAENPRATSAEMAAGLTAELHPAQPLTEAGIRKTLQRARARFADLLLDEVACSLGNATLEEIEQELIDSSLLDYCRSALRRRRAVGQDDP